MSDVPSFIIDLSEHGQVLIVHFSPYEWSQDVILIAFPNRILVAKLQVENNCTLQKICQFQDETICNALALSPECSLSVLPNIIQFCAAGDDYKLRIFESSTTEPKVLAGHSDYINDISFDPGYNYLVSVSDDQTAKIWSTIDFTSRATLYLTSAGIATCWHKEDNSKLLVAEKIGLIRFYNVNTGRPILCLDYGKPLSSAHWSSADSNLVISLQQGELLYWNLTKPSGPTFKQLLYAENGGMVKLSSFGWFLAALNRLEGTLKVANVRTQQQCLSVNLTLTSNITWHNRVPILALGSHNKLLLWKIVT